MKNKIHKAKKTQNNGKETKFNNGMNIFLCEPREEL